MFLARVVLILFAVDGCCRLLLVLLVAVRLSFALVVDVVCVVFVLIVVGICCWLLLLVLCAVVDCWCC